MNKSNKKSGRLGLRHVLLILIILAILGLGKFGFGWFGGSGSGGSEGRSPQRENTEETKDVHTITIEVKQDKYLIDGAELSLEDIKHRLASDTKKMEVVLENNYAAAKAWDEIKNALSEFSNITVVEQ